MSCVKRIMIVEDEWLLAEDISKQLRSRGYEVAGPFPTVRRALAEIESAHIDAAILDVQLDAEDSFPVADRLIEADIPFMFLTARAASEFPVHLADSVILAKPAQWELLEASLRRMTAPKS